MPDVNIKTMDTPKLRYQTWRSHTLKWGAFLVLLFLIAFFYMSITSQQSLEIKTIDGVQIAPETTSPNEPNKAVVATNVMADGVQTTPETTNTKQPTPVTPVVVIPQVKITDMPDLRSLEQKFVAQGIREERIHLRTKAEWQAFWRRFSETKAPEVDFTRNDMIIVLMGTYGSSGYSVNIRNVSLASEGVNAELLFCLPPPNSTLLTVMTSPYDIKLIPKVNGAVRWLTEKGQTGLPPCN